MHSKATSQEIDMAAAMWAARVDARELSASEECELSAWLESDVRHLGAYAKALAVCARTEQASAFRTGFDVDMLTEAPVIVTRRRVMLVGGAVAACALAAIGIGFRDTGMSFATGIGETRVIPLEDGSVITLNTNSEIVVDFGAAQRKVRLSKGEALFDVAKDRRRPFVVDAEGMLVRAVGTSFVVQTLPQAPLTVLVAEGTVEMRHADTPNTGAVRVTVNMRATAPRGAAIATERLSSSELSRQMAWRIGRLAFEGETLAQAAGMFARYSDVHIVIKDPAIAERTVTGLYVFNDPIGFAKAVAIGMNLHVQIENGEVRLTR